MIIEEAADISELAKRRKFNSSMRAGKSKSAKKTPPQAQMVSEVKHGANGEVQILPNDLQKSPEMGKKQESTLMRLMGSQTKKEEQIQGTY